MKILFICKGHFDSGIEFYKSLCAQAESELLIDMEGGRYTQSVIDADTAEIALGMHPDLAREYELVRQIRDNFNLEHEKISMVKYHSLALKDYQNFLISRRVVQWIKEKKFDLIHYYGSSLPWLQQMVFLKGVPRIFTVHDYILHFGESHGRAWNYKFYMKAITENRTHNFHLLSETMRNEFCAYYGVQQQRTIVAKFGSFEVYLKHARPDVQTENQTILFFGRISPYKGIEYLAEAGKNLQSRFPNLRIIIAGAGELYFDRSIIENNSIFEIYNYHISNSLLAQLLQRSSIVVCPYIEATQSGVLMTAYAFNKPVIASDVGSFREYVVHNTTGLLVPPKDSKALADAVSSLLADQDRLTAMIAQIQRTKESESSWARSAVQLSEFYLSICTRHNK
ncbi:MAG: glycosyltransferase family 4 protein [Bacteroidota bacterium]|jgi:glycosyltransferase involved in cell wall biosynthesis